MVFYRWWGWQKKEDSLLRSNPSVEQLHVENATAHWCLGEAPTSRHRRRADTVCKVKAFREQGRTQVLRKRDTMGGVGTPWHTISILWWACALQKKQAHHSHLKCSLRDTWSRHRDIVWWIIILFLNMNLTLQRKIWRTFSARSSIKRGGEAQKLVLVTTLWHFWASQGQTFR